MCEQLQARAHSFMVTPVGLGGASDLNVCESRWVCLYKKRQTGVSPSAWFGL